jgi:UDP-N-acetylglucosamine 4,6-dehydratase (inverting)
MLNNKTILITGGTGSFGKKFLSVLLKKYKNIKKIIIFSRDELKQYEMSLEYPKKKYSNIRFFLGDVRDKNRLYLALEGVDFVVHAAALKQVNTAEYNPFEFIQTNVIGANNLIEASIERGVKKIIALSTDKACAPINLYGATKLCSDKLFVAANNITGNKKISFSVVRYGNVMMSRGSVIPHFLDTIEKGYLNITNEQMTRFNITLEQSVNFVLNIFKISIGGEIFVPKLPSYKIAQLVDACIKLKKIKKNIKKNIIGVREGEKLHEEMITISDSLSAIETKNFYVILGSKYINYRNFIKKINGKKVVKPFSYNSLNNPKYLTSNQLTDVIKKF